jgi:predicted regulator of Ras-like GTPase activity (Roadblock/LC7/MglB family)
MFNEPSVTQPSGLKELCQQHLLQLQETLSGMRVAVVSTADGFPIAMVETTPQGARRATAMAAALNGLSQTLTKELATGQLEGTVLECQQGLILCRHVAMPKRALVILMVVDAGATYGHALWAIKQAAKDLSTALHAWVESKIE